MLQQEQDSTVNRLSRLEPDDKYKGAEQADRPQAVTSTKPKEVQLEKQGYEKDTLLEAFSKVPQRAGKQTGDNDKALLFIENAKKAVNSAITQEDFEVFFRCQTYKNQCLRFAKKAIVQIKWLPMSHRYSIWAESRIRMNDYKKK